jgi:CubicO group peptidase (beta-lactamase class C family)
MARTRFLTLAGLGVVILAAGAGWFSFREPDLSQVPIHSLNELERQLESLRARLQVPGMSAAIAQKGSVFWARGFGLANRERAIAAEPDTIYHLASLTKPYGSTVVLQLVEEGRLNLDDPVSRFGISMARSVPVRVWHLLSHTSGEPPGNRYRYDGNAFGALTRVVERTTGELFAKELADRIIRPLALTETAPNPGEPRAFWSLVASVAVAPADVESARAAFSASNIDRESIETALAQGYARAWGQSIWPSGLIGPMRPMPHGFTLSTTAGLVSSAPDVARFSMALDRGVLLTEESRARAWTPPLAPDGKPLPYALGWFVQVIRGRKIVWHYGHGLESSSLIVKIADDGATFVILANSDGLSRWRGLGGTADVLTSPAARLFLNWYFANNRAEEPRKRSNTYQPSRRQVRRSSPSGRRIKKARDRQR